MTENTIYTDPVEAAQQVLREGDNCLRSPAALRAVIRDLLAERERAVNAMRERAAKVAAAHFIPGHSIAGPAFAEMCANKIRNILTTSPEQPRPELQRKPPHCW